MSTRGFVGFKKDNDIRGWYNHFDSYYEGLGNKVLEKYKKHNNRELKNFFNNIILVKNDPEDRYYDNHKVIFKEDWSISQPIILQDGTEFLNDGIFCEYGYVFNLDSDTVEVYRGFFKIPQYKGQKGTKGYDGTMFYVNKVFEITRDNIGIAQEIFNNEGILYNENVEYWEKEFINNIKGGYN